MTNTKPASLTVYSVPRYSQSYNTDTDGCYGDLTQSSPIAPRVFLSGEKRRTNHVLIRKNFFMITSIVEEEANHAREGMNTPSGLKF